MCIKEKCISFLKNFIPRVKINILLLSVQFSDVLSKFMLLWNIKIIQLQIIFII